MSLSLHAVKLRELPGDDSSRCLIMPASTQGWCVGCEAGRMIRKLKSGKYRLYSRKIDARTNRRRNLGTFDTREAAEKHERAVQYFKRH